MESIEKQLEYFKKLTEDRKENARTLEKPAMRGVQRSVVDKYSDQAHFIYELLQNADDVNATQSKFILKEDGLFFYHNGTIGFSISNPENEEEDTKFNKLGHLNAITSIANSNKNESSIGKFGVGFKAVFQYTETPHIYDPIFKFKIERFIVPLLLEDDLAERDPGETVFYFPFDLESKKEEAYIDILQKLKSLVHPVLFLNNLKEVTWETASEKGKYSKSIKESRIVGDTLCQLISLQEKKEKLDRKLVWLFTRKIEGLTHKYSTGFFLNKHRKLEAISHPAFCFFPTKESTNLNFLVQAPFLLTDSREGIKAGEAWNKDLISKLAVLAAESLLILKQIGVEKDTLLIEDTIINLIPYNEGEFTEVGDRNKISFKPFYSAIKGKLQSEILLPALNGKYSAKFKAYWAADTELTDLFSDNQLMQLGWANANWVFPSLGRKLALNERINGKAIKANYIDDLITDSLDPDKILRRIDKGFIEKQTFDWLKKFYTYLLDKRSYWDTLKKKPIFKNPQGEAVAAFDESGKNLILFLPTKEDTDYQTIHKTFLSHPDSLKFFEAFGITKPVLKDEIFNKILPLYKAGFNINDSDKLKTHFAKLFNYYEDCPQNQLNDYIQQLKDIDFLFCRTFSNSTSLKKPGYCYYPTEELISFFELKNEISFIDLSFYSDLLPTNKLENLKEFLIKLGVNQTPIIYPQELGLTNSEKKDKGLVYYSTRYSRVYDKYLEGSKKVIENITIDKSLLLWQFLNKLIKEKGLWQFRNILQGRHEYFYIKDKWETFDSEEFIRLTTERWLYKNDGQLVSVSEISANELAPYYDTVSPEAKELISFLGIDNPDEELDLSDEQRKIYELGKKLMQQGVSENDIPELIQLYHQRANSTTTGTQNGNSSSEETGTDKTINKIRNKIKESSLNKTPEKQAENQSENTKEETDPKDEDFYTKPPVNFDKQIAKKEEELRAEIEALTRIQELTEAANQAERYSFLWFKSLLELEYLNSSECNSKGKEISIQFAKVENEADTDRILILKHPNRYIPHTIEDIGGLSVRLISGIESRSISIEVVSVKEYTLRAKLNSTVDISDLDLTAITKAIIDIKNPIFILEELRNNFNRLPFDDDYNLKQHLTENIEFIFGPPGTGKTTYLAKDILFPLMKKPEDLKILVLTPTNKASDVLVRRIKEVMQDDERYYNWLVRFGITGDPEIEQSPIFKDKSFDIRTKPKNVTITTIARFPYDYFNPLNADNRLHLRELSWDYIIIDEASMIPIANIVYPLFYKTEAKFIIAGDPFQIQPITTVDTWKDENIYSMVELNKFSNPTTKPHDYNVINLTTQYRSIPSIGNLFSNFTYEGVLKHNRSEDSQRPLEIDGFKLNDINIIKFPVMPFDSIFRPNRLNKTPFHVYSALFTFELVTFLSNQINKNHSENYRIGIICPYRAQATLVEKLFATTDFDIPNVDIQIGTIHGFQGDECDIIISLFNPPPYISDSPNMFLNKQNILNVAISRARDYLFILMPDERTENVSKLYKVNRIEKLITEKAQGRFSKMHSRDLEQIIFENDSYIEENSFSTSHQAVNVYAEAEKLYEIRCEETAIDVQVSKRKAPLNKHNKHKATVEDVETL